MTPRRGERRHLLATAIIVMFVCLAGKALMTQASLEGEQRGRAAERVELARANATAQVKDMTKTFTKGEALVMRTAQSNAHMSANSANACALPTWLPETVSRWRDSLCEAAASHGVPPSLLAIIVTVESGGDPRARSHANALGLGQIVPRWWPAITRDGDWRDPEHNLDIAATVLADALRRYGIRDEGEPWTRTVDRAAATYNGGSPANTSAETRAYRAWVSGMWAERDAEASATLVRWYEAGGSRLVSAASAD